MSSRSARADRVLVQDGRRHHRKTYSRKEFRIGLVCLAVLALVLVWVAWRGANPDPALFEASIGQAGAAAPEAAGPVDRGPLPEGLAAEGWTEGRVSSFDWDNLYVKINGREGYYKQFGFERLYFLSLVAEDDPATVVDIEVYDLGNPDNARGAASGERPEGAVTESIGPDTNTLFRNSLYLTRGRFYVRAIGSDETPTVVAQLEQVRDAFAITESGEEIPWSWQLFGGELGMDTGSISFQSENAFSFGFATNVYSVLLNDETELFAVAEENAEAAAALAQRFNQGFLEYGVALEPSGGVSWAEDRYLKAVSGAKSVGPWTVGVRGAPDAAAAAAHLQRLEEAARNLQGE